MIWMVISNDEEKEGGDNNLVEWEFLSEDQSRIT